MLLYHNEGRPAAPPSRPSVTSPPSSPYRHIPSVTSLPLRHQSDAHHVVERRGAPSRPLRYAPPSRPLRHLRACRAGGPRPRRGWGGRLVGVDRRAGGVGSGPGTALRSAPPALIGTLRPCVEKAAGGAGRPSLIRPGVVPRTRRSGGHSQEKCFLGWVVANAQALGEAARRRRTLSGSQGNIFGAGWRRTRKRLVVEVGVVRGWWSRGEHLRNAGAKTPLSAKQSSCHYWNQRG